jgi:hypothetical protein
MVPLGLLRQEDGNQLVAALSYLASRLVEADVVAEPYHGLVPCDRVQINGIRQGAIQVEDRGTWQSNLHFTYWLSSPKTLPIFGSTKCARVQAGQSMPSN